MYITMKMCFNLSPFISPFSAGWHGKHTVKTEMSLSMFATVECNCTVFLLQLIICLFHIKGVVIE